MFAVSLQYLSKCQSRVSDWLFEQLCVFFPSRFSIFSHRVGFTLDGHDRRKSPLTSHRHTHTHTHTHTHCGPKNNSGGGLCRGSDGVCPGIQCEAVTTNSRQRPSVPALRKLKFWENPAPVCSVMTDFSPVVNVNIEMHACANGLNTRRHIRCQLDAFHPLQRVCIVC